MAQAPLVLRRYAAPTLTVYGRLEDVTLTFENGEAPDNACSDGRGSNNSGAFCGTAPLPPGGVEPDTGATSSLLTEIQLVDPALAQEMTGISSGE
ncbi:MAG: hypothetical protein L6Q98_06560 [Anaerolineae bacterium]|nr:hypothetical protein [Anaerolineae bacterium]NUQ02845.1 hypothetical protein [Anaerolineae bacterium]